MWADGYQVGFDTSLELNNTGRRINSIKLNDDTKTLEENNKMYRDLHETVVFEVAPGANVAPTFILNGGSWIHGLVYVDLNQNGDFAVYDGNEYTLDEGENVSNSASSGTLGSTFTCTSFTAPTTPGDYRMRFKADWNGGDPRALNPAGRIGNNGTYASNDENSIVKNSGSIVDVTLRVLNTITYEYIFNGNKVAEEQVYGAVGSAYPTPTTLPWGVEYTLPEGTISGNTTERVVVSLSSEYPFEYSTDFANATWYMLTIRSNYHPYYDAESNNFLNTGNGGAKVQENKGYFAFVGTPWGTKIINRAAGESKAVSGTPNVNNSALTTADYNDAIEFVFENNSGHYVFAAKSNAVAHINNIAGDVKLGFWNAGASATDPGSTLAFEEADLSLDAALKSAIAEAKTTLSSINVPVLFSASDVSNALDDVNAISYDDTDADDIASKTAEFNSIMENLYASAEGKKFTYKSTMYSTTRYLAATAEVGALSTTEDVTKFNVFELEHVSGANYKVKASFVDAYLDNTSTKASAGIYKLIYQGAENYISLQFNNTSNAIHHQQTGNLPVSWSTSSEASKWYVAAVSDDEWNELIAVPDWNGLDAAITAAESHPIGNGLGKYTATAGFADDLRSAKAMAEAQTASVSDVEAAIASITTSKLTINLPQPGSFLRIKGAATNTYISGIGTANSQVPLTSNADEAVLYYTTDGKLVSPTCGMGFSGTHSYTANATIEAHTFTEAPYAVGAYLIKSNYSGSKVLVDWTDGKVNRWSTEKDVRSTWYVEEVDFIPITLSVVDGKSYTTFYSPVAVILPSDVQAYVVTKDDDTHASLALIESGVVPANTGVILYSKTGATSANLTIGGVAGSETSELTGNAATIAAVECATLQNKDGNVGLYKFNGATLKGFKAYLPASSGIKNLAFNFDEETIIKAIEEAELKAGNIYDMSGRQVGKAQKGLYIQNGKKFIVK